MVEKSPVPQLPLKCSSLITDGMIVPTIPSSNSHLLLNFLCVEWQNKHSCILLFFGLTDVSIKKTQAMVLSRYVAFSKFSSITKNCTKRYICIIKNILHIFT